MPARRKFRGRRARLAYPTGGVSHGIRAVHATDNQPVVINTKRIVVPVPPEGQGTRITFANGSHQDVKELIADVLRRLNISS